MGAGGDLALVSGRLLKRMEGFELLIVVVFSCGRPILFAGFCKSELVEFQAERLRILCDCLADYLLNRHDALSYNLRFLYRRRNNALSCVHRTYGSIFLLTRKSTKSLLLDEPIFSTLWKKILRQISCYSYL